MLKRFPVHKNVFSHVHTWRQLRQGPSSDVYFFEAIIMYAGRHHPPPCFSLLLYIAFERR